MEVTPTLDSKADIGADAIGLSSGAEGTFLRRNIPQQKRVSMKLINDIWTTNGLPTVKGIFEYDMYIDVYL